MLWTTEWRKDQKDLPERELAAADGLNQFFKTASCSKSTSIQRIPSASNQSAEATIAAAIKEFDKVVLITIRELGPVAKIGASLALVGGSAEVVLDTSEQMVTKSPPRKFTALLRLVWESSLTLLIVGAGSRTRHAFEGRGRQVDELARDKVGDGDQVAGGAVATGLGLGGLDERVGCFHAAVGQFGVEGVEDAVPVGLEGGGDLLDRGQAAAARPAVPLRQQWLCRVAIGGGAEDLAQGFFDPESAVGLEVQALEIGVLVDLTGGPVLRVLQPQVAAALEAGGGFRLVAADLVDGLVDQLDHVELIEGDRGPRQVLSDSRLVAGGHINADRADVLGTSPVRFEVVGELLHHRGLAPFTGEHQAPGIQIVEQADVIVPAPRCGLVQTDGGDVGEVLLGARLIDVVVKGAPDAHIADCQQLRHLPDRHGLAQRHDQGLHQQGEPTAGAGPRHRHLGGLAAVAAAHPRHLRVEVGLELEEVQMPPFPHQGVMHRLVFGPAVRAGEARSRLKGHLKVDAPRLRIEGHIGYFPGRLQAQGQGEQGRRRSSHGSTLTRTACGFVDASCGPARALRDVWTTPGPRRQPPCDRRASHRRGPPVAHTLGPRAHNSTGTATSLFNGAGHGGQWN